VLLLLLLLLLWLEELTLEEKVPPVPVDEMWPEDELPPVEDVTSLPL
jgi:hypothetical protein